MTITFRRVKAETEYHPLQEIGAQDREAQIIRATSADGAGPSRATTTTHSAGAGAAFVADGLLTGVLVKLLHTQRTGVKRWVPASTPSPLSTEADHPPDREHSMDRVVDTLILYGVNTGTRA